MKKEIAPVTMETMQNVSAFDRPEAIYKYHLWLKEVRRKDKKDQLKIISRVNAFLYRKKQLLTSRYITIDETYTIIWKHYIKKNGELTSSFCVKRS